MAGLRQPAQVIFDSARFQLGEVSGRVLPREGDMIEHSAAFGNDRLFDDMQHGLALAIEPSAGERERRARPRREAEDVSIESDRLSRVGGENREMVHPKDWHGITPSRMRAFCER